MLKPKEGRMKEEMKGGNRMEKNYLVWVSQNSVFSMYNLGQFDKCPHRAVPKGEQGPRGKSAPRAISEGRQI